MANDQEIKKAQRRQDATVKAAEAACKHYRRLVDKGISEGASWAELCRHNELVGQARKRAAEAFQEADQAIESLSALL